MGRRFGCHVGSVPRRANRLADRLWRSQKKWSFARFRRSPLGAPIRQVRNSFEIVPGFRYAIVPAGHPLHRDRPNWHRRKESNPLLRFWRPRHIRYTTAIEGGTACQCRSGVSPSTAERSPVELRRRGRWYGCRARLSVLMRDGSSANEAQRGSGPRCRSELFGFKGQIPRRRVRSCGAACGSRTRIIRFEGPET
jgi:hypothetical protein